MKRLFDISFSLLGLILCLPLFIIVAIATKLDSKGPVFFRQERMGKGFKPFMIYKFRSMKVDSFGKGALITARGDDRVTRVGRFLRKMKVDELPQLINVLKGDMSLEGPRPEVRKYVELFKTEYDGILKMKPGITDHATLEFRDEEAVLSRYPDPEEGYVREVLPAKIELYKKYRRESNLFTDIKLILMTLRRIVSG